MDNFKCLLVVPDEEHFLFVTPTVRILKTALASIKKCQAEKIDYENYVKIAHEIIDDFIKPKSDKEVSFQSNWNRETKEHFLDGSCRIIPVKPN